MSSWGFGEFPVPPAMQVQNGQVNTGPVDQQMLNALKALVARLAPPVQLTQTWFDANVGAIGNQTNLPLNQVTINGFLFSLTAGAVDVYIGGSVTGHPHLSQVGAGTFYLPIPPLPNINSIVFVSSGAVAALGSVCIICY